MKSDKMKIPREMYEAAKYAYDRNWQENGAVITKEILEAALRWLAENPIVPTDEQVDEMIDSYSDLAGSPGATKRLIAEWIRRMYLTPEPEVDRIDFYTKGSDGEYRPWKPTEEQVRLGGEFFRSPIRCLDCGNYFRGDSCPCKKKSNPEVLDAKQRVLAVYPGATEMPDASGVPSADYCIVRPATKEDWPENKWVQVGPYVSGDPWEAAALRIHASGVPEEIKDLLLADIREGFFKPEVVNERMAECFRRGQKAGTK